MFSPRRNLQVTSLLLKADQDGEKINIQVGGKRVIVAQGEFV